MASGMYEIISKKRDGLELERDEIAFVISGYVKGEIPDYQVAAWLMAVYIRGLNDRELADLTEIMLDSGDRISLDGVPGKKIDKHSTGGVGDKISFILAPLRGRLRRARAHALRPRPGPHRRHPGQAGSHPGHERLPHAPNEFRSVLAETGMVICGQTDNIVPADKKLYALRDVTATVSCIPLIASSIMSKKLALGSDGIVLDVKTGSGAFMRDGGRTPSACAAPWWPSAKRPAAPPWGSSPAWTSRWAAPWATAWRSSNPFEALKGQGPADVMEVTFALGWCMLRAAGKEMDYAQAVEKFQEAIASGRALDVFRRFIAAQGGDAGLRRLFPAARQPQQDEFPAPVSGYISRIDSFEVGMAAIDTGAGRRNKEDAIAYGSGFVFHANVGDEVERGQKIVTIHSDRPDACRPSGSGWGPASRWAATRSPGRKWSCTWWTRTASALAVLTPW